MDLCNTPGLTPLDDASAAIRKQLPLPGRTEEVTLTNALGRALAEPVCSHADVPPWDNSAMDGYALNLSSGSEEFTVTGTCLAGETFSAELSPGQALRIMTGAPIPSGTDTVIMQEYAQLNGDKVTFSCELNCGTNIRRKGEALRSGAPLFSTGHQLTASDLAVLSSAGVAKLKCYRKLKVALISNGDELREPGSELQPGQIYESTRPALNALLKNAGYLVTDAGILPDVYVTVRDRLLELSRDHDVIISSGGVSAGEADYTCKALSETGKLAIWKLAMKPGKPFAAGSIGDCIFFGLPGNPVSALVTFDQLARPALHFMQSGTELQHRTFRARAVSPFRKRPGRTDFQRVQISMNEDNELTATATGAQGSHILSSLSQADGYAILERERGDIEPGEWVDIRWFSPLF